jgi:hypothetical protein
MPPSPLPNGPSQDASDLREVILSVFEQSLQAQLAAVRRLKLGKEPSNEPEGVGRKRRSKGRSQVDLAYDILSKAHGPLHISTLLERIEAAFGLKVDSESLVSALSKKVARKDRFTRTQPNTFGLLQ